MSSTGNTRNNSSAIAPSTSALKKLSTKLEAKMEKAKCKLHMTKTFNKTNEIPVKPDHTNKAAQPKRTGWAVELFEKQERAAMKTANKVAKKDARKARWAARRISLKGKSGKVGKALLIPVAAVLGVVLAPLILAIDVAWGVLCLAFWLLVKILDIICAPFVCCYYFGFKS